MTSPARIAMLTRAVDAQRAVERVTAQQAELVLAVAPEQRDALVGHFAEQNRPEKVYARVARLARYARRRRAAERPFADMAGFERQFRKPSA